MSRTKLKPKMKGVSAIKASNLKENLPTSSTSTTTSTQLAQKTCSTKKATTAETAPTRKRGPIQSWSVDEYGYLLARRLTMAKSNDKIIKWQNSWPIAFPRRLHANLRQVSTRLVTRDEGALRKSGALKVWVKRRQDAYDFVESHGGAAAVRAMLEQNEKTTQSKQTERIERTDAKKILIRLFSLKKEAVIKLQAGQAPEMAVTLKKLKELDPPKPIRDELDAYLRELCYVEPHQKGRMTDMYLGVPTSEHDANVNDKELLRLLEARVARQGPRGSLV